jgi:hypothetical protein
MRLSIGAKWVYIAIGLFELGILLICLEPLVNSGEAHKLQESTAEWAGAVSLICTYGSLFHVPGPQEMAIQSGPFLKLEYMRHDWVVKQVLANMRRVNLAFDAELGQLCPRSNSRQHEHLRGLISAVSM